MGSEMRRRGPGWLRGFGVGLAAGIVMTWTVAAAGVGAAAGATQDAAQPAQAQVQAGAGSPVCEPPPGGGVQVETIDLLAGTEHATPMTVIRAGQDGPVVLAVGGVHGNKPAGVEAGKALAQFRDLERGTLIVIPALNRAAVEAGQRSVDTDLNRAFPTSSGSQPTDPRARAVWDVMRQYDVDYLIDMHEDAQPWTSSGLGNVLVYRRAGTNQATAELLKAALDKTSSQAWRLGGEPISSGLVRSAQDVLGISAFYVSTARTNSMELRVHQHVTAVMTLLDALDMVPGDPELPEPPGDEPGDGEPDPTPEPGVRVETIDLMAGTEHATPMTVIRAGQDGPVVLAVGGVHGNKPAGVEAGKALAQFRDLERGTLIVIPALNRAAVEAGQRSVDTDLNRAFPTSSGSQPTDPRARAVWDVMRQYDVDYLIDMHEDAQPWTSSGLGNVLVYRRAGTNQATAELLKAALDKTSSQAWRLGGEPISSGLVRSAQDVLGVSAFYVSTARTNPMDLRVHQHVTAVMTLLDALDMVPGDPELPEPPGDEPGEEPGDGAPDNQVTVRTILSGTVHATKLYVIDSGVPGPTVWISGGVHGSELAGWMAAEKIAEWRVSRGRLVVVPHAFELAVQQRLRAARGYSDLNRQFPTSSGGSPSGTLARGLWEELKRYRPDWVFDLHEAMSNRNINPNSVGQTMIVYPNSEINAMADTVIKRINRNLSSTLRFQMLRYPVQGSLARAAGQFLGANAAIVETSRLYDLNDRINWHLTLMRYVLEELDMGPITRTSSLTPVSDRAA